MALSRGVCSLFLACAGWASAQDAPPAPPLDSRLPPAYTDANIPPSVLLETVPLIVPEGTAVEIALDEEIRIRKVGQSISGHVVEPVYAFDKLVVPVGTAAAGRITNIEATSNGNRRLSAQVAEFTPAHQIDVEYPELVLPDAKHLPIPPRVTPRPGQVILRPTAADAGTGKGVIH